ncbi:MAG: radical SAM family heme chaperone HemW [Elusimicrobiota bacterium]
MFKIRSGHTVQTESVYRERRSRGFWFYPPQVLLEPDWNGIDLNDRSDHREQSIIYVQIPFCSSFCTYCLFSDVVRLNQKDLVEDYLAALEKEILSYAKTEYVRSLEFGTIYFGGGTPSCLLSTQLQRLLNIFSNEFNLSEDVQITVEGNSSSFNEEKLSSILANGVNRISLGVQTFNDEIGKILNLPHNHLEVSKIIEKARKIGHELISIDLMYNLPGQTMEVWESDLDTAVSLGLDHITVYCLIIPPAKKLKTTISRQLENRKIPPVGTQEKTNRMYEAALRKLEKAGFRQDSLTDFTRHGIREGFKYARLISESRNTLGLGPRAFGYLNHCMYINCKSLDDYMNLIAAGRISIEMGRRNSKKEEMHGFMVVGLRALSVKKKEFFKRFGIELEEVFSQTLESLKKKGMIISDDEEVRLSQKGIIWGGNVCSEFMSDNTKKMLRAYEQQKK